MINTTRRRKSYDIKFKLNALTELEKNDGNISITARQLGITNKMLRDWKKKSLPLKLAKNKNVCKIGSGMVPKYPEIETKLFEWFRNERIVFKRVVDYRRLIQEAKDLVLQECNLEWTPSKNWVGLFMKRHSLSLRRVSHVSQEDQRSMREISEIASKYISGLNLAASEFSSNDIYNMDETPVYIDMLSTRTISFKGEKSTESCGTGHGKTRFTVVLCISAAGRIIKTLVILKGLKKVPKAKTPKNILVKVTKGGSMNEKVMLEWINEVFAIRDPVLIPKKSLLIMDEFGVHKMGSVISLLKKRNAETIFIPPKTTYFLQPLDVSINGPFKIALRNEWTEWQANGAKEYTEKGYRKRPSWEDIFRMVDSAVNKIKRNVVENAFGCCGLRIRGSKENNYTLNNKLRKILSFEEIVSDSENKTVQNQDN